MESIKKHIKGEKFIFDKSGSIFLENLSTLIFSDLHLGKGLTFANQGNLVPPFDLDETLFNLENIINKYKPKKLFIFKSNSRKSRLLHFSKLKIDLRSIKYYHR